MFRSKTTLILIAVLFTLTTTAFSEVKIDDLKENQSINGFKALSVYENGSGKAMGARFISEKYGFLLDYLQIESVPQAFYWIKTPPSSSKGEPHSCEHLLLGKGNKGRYVASLKDMALSSSTAYTAQVRTCYHFNTVGGSATFYKLFEAQLQALLHPDFTDEEIEREVSKVGVNVDPETGELSIDEKGTCYTEMVSAFEKPWYYSYGTLNKLVYGENHPLTNNSGGNPDVMRTMVPADMWKFHKETHHLSNMGAIVSMPSDISLGSFLESMNKILESCQDYKDINETPTIRVQNLPESNNKEIGTATIAYYPSDNEADPGYIMYAWPPTLKLDNTEELMMDLFLNTFASGQTSNLYNIFMNSETKKIDIGGNYISGGYDNDLDISINFVLSGVNGEAVTLDKMENIKEMILAELKRIQDFEDGSDELKEFNKRFTSGLVETEKYIANYLNSPPMFGFRRGSASGWTSLLMDVEKDKSFRKSLVTKNRFAAIKKELEKDSNIWRERISIWKLLEIEPYSVGTLPSNSILENKRKAKKQRLLDYVESYKKQFDVTTEQEAIAKYKEDYDAKTKAIEALASNDKLPEFTENPPMTLDDQLNYESIKLDENNSIDASTFDNMSASTFSIALRMDVIPENLLVYAPIIPKMISSIGVVEKGEVVTYDQMSDRLKNEVLGFNASYSFGAETDRIELVLTGKGGNKTELHNSITWMENTLLNSYLSSDNLPRIRDVINQSLISYRNRTKRSEEAWVNNPANAYRFEKNPLYLSTNSFLTEIHHISRIKWFLTDPGNETEQQSLRSQIDLLRDGGNGKNREELSSYLESYESVETGNVEENKSNTIKDITRFLKTSLVDIPDENISEDWTYLCNQIKNDLMIKPEKALSDIKTIFSLLAKTDNVRLTMISNKKDRDESLDKISELLSKLDNTTASIYQKYSSINNITERLKSREELNDKPVYAGLVFDGTNNGVLMFSAEYNDKFATDEESLLRTLSGKLYTGYGPHGLFMKTWAAGLAYSNGFRNYAATGRTRYYAERCPDVAETMRFVVNELKTAKENPDLADYTVAQIFGASRASDRYEQRGLSMANDIADGIKPENISEFRQAVLDMRATDDYYMKIKSKMEDVYGTVLIGYGKPLAESKNGNFFLIGPEPQFESLETYIKQTEGEQKVYRLYPRDFWLTN